GAGLGVADVVAHGAGEQERRLLHDAELAPVRGEVELADVEPVHQYPPALELVEAGDQLAYRRLPGPGVADERHRLARLDHQVEADEHRLAGVVVEVDALELDAALQPARVARPGLRDAGLGVDQGEDALAGREPQMELAPERGDRG